MYLEVALWRAAEYLLAHLISELKWSTVWLGFGCKQIQQLVRLYVFERRCTCAVNPWCTFLCAHFQCRYACQMSISAISWTFPVSNSFYQWHSPHLKYFSTTHQQSLMEPKWYDTKNGVVLRSTSKIKLVEHTSDDKPTSVHQLPVINFRVRQRWVDDREACADLVTSMTRGGVEVGGATQRICNWHWTRKTEQRFTYFRANCKRYTDVANNALVRDRTRSNAATHGKMQLRNVLRAS